MTTASDQDNAAETALSRDRRHSLSLAAHDRLKTALLSDSYLFARVICRHLDLVPAIHMPLSYLVCGLTDRLIETLEMKNLDSYVTRKLRHEFGRRQIDWTTPQGRAAIDDLINGSLIRPATINIRMSRRFFKSSVVTHAGTLFMATVNPNETIKITHAVDPKAWGFCEQIGRTVLSGTYRDFFPDRVPDSALVSMKRITLNGRTISHPQTTIQASGYQTKEESAHYSIQLDDDLVTDLNSSPDMLRGVHQYLRRRTGYFMPTWRIRLIEVGTKHDEDDDDTFFTTGRMSEECLTLRVPIEEHKGKIGNILERGKPTCPELFPVEKINAEQAHVLSDEDDEDGYRTWWNQYLLSATGGSLRLFPPELVDDSDHWWMGPYEHPNKNWARRGHFLVARYARDRNGNPLAKDNHTVWEKDGTLRDDWHDHASVVSFDPWADMDRVILVDPSWSENVESDNWAVSCVGQDYETSPVRYQLQTLSDTTGIEGWVTALIHLDEVWNPRVWGIDATAMQDPMIENMLKNDRRLRRLISRMVKIHHVNKAKALRMREGIAEPMLAYRFLLAPPYRDDGATDSFGGTMTRSELKMIKSTPKHAVKNDQDGIADSLAMATAVLRAARKREVPAPEDNRPVTVQQRVHPILGLPLQ